MNSIHVFLTKLKLEFPSQKVHILVNERPLSNEMHSTKYERKISLPCMYFFSLSVSILLLSFQISGIAKQFHQDFFKDLEKEKNIALENIVYYRGDTHYFVMTALRNSLIERGVILEDNEDRKALLAPSNIDRQKLHQFAIDAAQV